MTREERDDSLYKALPLSTRIIIRTIVVLMSPLNRMLEKERMTASFDISIIMTKQPPREEEYMQ